MSIEQLLNQVSSINRLYEKIKLPGENFNIFNILDLSSKELVHSKIVAMLLDPKGEHGMGDKFLQLFRDTISKTIGTEKLDTIDFSDTTVKTEKYSDSGRIDILITAKNKKVIIENKIYADDSLRQLLRYYNDFPGAVLLYLTLNGKRPNDVSIKDKEKELEEGIHYDCISYSRDILEWLKKCKKEAVNNPCLRETISQYIFLLKQLTGQTMSNEMAEVYTNIIAGNKDNAEAAFIIFQYIDDSKIQILKKYFKPLIEELAKNYDFELEMNLDRRFKDKYWGFKLIKNRKKFSFWFEGGQGLCYGINSKDVPEELNKHLRDIRSDSLGNYLGSDSFSIYRYFEGDKYRYWTDNFYLDLFSTTDDVKEVFENKIEELKALVKKAGYEL